MKPIKTTSETYEFRCVDDRFDRTGTIPYDSPADFLAMCRECFGEAPELREGADGDWYETEGERAGCVVLERRYVHGEG